MNFPPAKVHKLERQYLECETFLRKKVTEFSFCTDNLLYEKLPLYRFRRCSDGGLFRRAFERAPKPFGARSKALRSALEKAWKHEPKGFGTNRQYMPCILYTFFTSYKTKIEQLYAKLIFSIEERQNKHNPYSSNEQ